MQTGNTEDDKTENDLAPIIGFLVITAIPLQNAEKSRYVCIMVTQVGGHIGFLEGINPRHRSYMDRVFSEFIDAIFRHRDELMQAL